MSSLKHVIVGIDGSASAQAALDWVVSQPAVERISAVHGFAPGQELLAAAAQVDFDAIRAERVEALNGVWTKTASDSDKDFQPPIFVDDDPARALLHAASSRKADAIVVGHRGDSWWDGHHLGHTASKLLHHSVTPVVIVGDRAQQASQQGPIVVGMSGTRNERNHNARWAMELAASCRVGVHFVDVAEPPAWVEISTIDEYRKIHVAHRAAMDEMVGRYRAEHPELSLSSEVRDGRALDMLLDAAGEVDASLIVIGSRHHGAIAGFLSGSVARHLPLLASCPVASVPMP